MKEPILVVMAAGMGSRYGGPKQIDPVGANGEIIIDYSIFDAMRAGFKRFVFIITHKVEESFKEILGNKLSKKCEVHYVFQDINNIPEGYSVPEGRVKPWGTGHAILSCADVIDAPFAVINADDYYGQNAFKVMYNFLSSAEDSDKCNYSMVGYILENTLTENGHVARGICTVEDGQLKDIVERTKIAKKDSATKYTEDDKTWIALPEGCTVSMNFWGFTPSIIEELQKEFPAFLDDALKTNPLKGEFFLPTVVDNMLKSDRATVRVFRSEDRWYGVTYKEDKQTVVAAIKAMTDKGIYPNNLWE